MPGSNAICVATALLDGGLVPMQEPVTELTLEPPGGLVRVRAECRDGKAERIFVENLPSFAARLGIPLEVEGLGTLTVDTAVTVRPGRYRLQRQGSNSSTLVIL